MVGDAGHRDREDAEPSDQDSSGLFDTGQTELQRFFTTRPMPCPYIEGRYEQRLVTFLSDEDDDLADHLHGELSRAGFRRSRNCLYRPICQHCSACKPVRVDVSRFQPNRTQKRLIKRLGNMQIAIQPAVATTRHYHVFRRYIADRHDDGGMSGMGWDDYRNLVESSPVTTGLVEFQIDGEVCAVSVTDWLDDGLSAVYSYFAPELHKLSLGTIMVLWHIREAQRCRLPYTYLGYWIAECRKMSYKDQFRPAQILTDAEWTDL